MKIECTFSLDFWLGCICSGDKVDKLGNKSNQLLNPDDSATLHKRPKVSYDLQRGRMVYCSRGNILAPREQYPSYLPRQQ